MKRGLIILTILSLICVSLQAQINDSINIKENPFYKGVLKKMYSSPLFYTHQKIKSVTEAKLEYTHKNLELKRVQTAGLTNSYQFTTEGVFNMDTNIKLFGNFNFSDIHEKDVAYNLTSERTENKNVLSPNYYFVPNAGDWDSKKYNLSGGVIYSIKPINLGATIFYNTENSSRNTDPRMGLTINDLGGDVHLGFILKRHSFYINGGASRKKEVGDSYYLDDSNNSSSNPDTFTVFSSGYARVVYESSDNDFIFQTIRNTLGGGYQFQKKHANIQVFYRYVYFSENMYGETGSINAFVNRNNIRFKYKNESHNLTASYYYDGKGKDFKACISYKKQQGDNFSVATNGQNYRMQLNEINFESGIIKTNKNISEALEFNVLYKNHSYIDLLGYTNKQLNTLDVEVNYNKDLVINKHILNASLGVTYYSVLNASLIFNSTSSSSNNFAQAVIIPDHAYDVLSKVLLNVGTDYKISLKNLNVLSIFADTNLLSFLDNKNEKYSSNFGKERSTWLNLGLRINY